MATALTLTFKGSRTSHTAVLVKGRRAQSSSKRSQITRNAGGHASIMMMHATESAPARRDGPAARRPKAVWPSLAALLRHNQVAGRARTLRTCRASPATAATAPLPNHWDAIVIGSGMGGLTTAARMVSKGAKVLVLEKYTIPGGSAGRFEREGYTFDVGSSMMFGFGEQGTTNLITKALASVGKRLATVPDPTQVHYHLPRSARFPQGLNVQVHRGYADFLAELTSRFPHEAAGIRGFYDECWTVFRALNSIELKSLEEPRYLMAQFVRSPFGCLTLASYLSSNTGEIARRHIRDPELLRFLDMECFTYSTVRADLTPMVTSGMVLSDRHYGGVNYPIGGIGRIAQTLADGITECGGTIVYKANVREILMSGLGAGARAVGVRLGDGQVLRSKTVISNATRWDTFENMIGDDRLPEGEKLFRQRYKKAPSFFSMHLGVKAEVLPKDTDCHHIILDDWERMEDARGTLFVSMPSLLDPSLAPEGRHVVHAFTPDWIDAWQGLSPEEYERQKEEVADSLCQRLEGVFPGIRQAITFREVGTPRTHRRFLNRVDGTYGPIPSQAPWGIVTMPLNTTDISGLYCVGDSTFPGQGVNAVVFSGFGCAHRALCDLGMEESWPPLVDQGFRTALRLAREAALRSGAPLQPGNAGALPEQDGMHAGSAAAPPVAAATKTTPPQQQQQQQQRALVGTAAAAVGAGRGGAAGNNILPFGKAAAAGGESAEEGAAAAASEAAVNN